MRLLLDTNVVLALIHERLHTLEELNAERECLVENLRLVTLDRALVAHPLAWRASD
jgi:hypothetical protein